MKKMGLLSYGLELLAFTPGVLLPLYPTKKGNGQKRPIANNKKIVQNPVNLLGGSSVPHSVFRGLKCFSGKVSRILYFPKTTKDPNSLLLGGGWNSGLL
ncbi:hypothetical protein NON20_24520 (plasmid) [Synechocystis sp. B12]|nr:hypothetical protein NON20_24520 [Synechocystis sp. B12]